MEFNFSEEQTMLRDLAREILENEVSLELQKEVEAGDAWFHEGLWRSLAEANLLGLAVPEEQGGMGFVSFCFRALPEAAMQGGEPK